MTLGQRDDGRGGQLHDHARLHRLGRSRVGPALDHRHAAEDLAGTEQLEHDIAAGARVPDDLDASGADEPEPYRRIPFQEDIFPRPLGFLAGGRGERLDLGVRKLCEHGTRAKERDGVLTAHSS
jgi:hypothetical protein